MRPKVKEAGLFSSNDWVAVKQLQYSYPNVGIWQIIGCPHNSSVI